MSSNRVKDLAEATEARRVATKAVSCMVMEVMEVILVGV